MVRSQYWQDTSITGFQHEERLGKRIWPDMMSYPTCIYRQVINHEIFSGTRNGKMFALQSLRVDLVVFKDLVCP